MWYSEILFLVYLFSRKGKSNVNSDSFVQAREMMTYERNVTHKKKSIAIVMVDEGMWCNSCMKLFEMNGDRAAVHTMK